MDFRSKFGCNIFFPHISATMLSMYISMYYVCSKYAAIFREHDTHVYENTNTNPEEEKYR